MNHQDWASVVLRKTLTKDENIKRGNFVTEAKQTAPNKVAHQSVQSYKLDGEDPVKPLYYGHALGVKLAQARQAVLKQDGTKKYPTQKDLALASKLPVATIKSYEDGKAIYKADDVNKIAKVLGVKLERPHKPKANSKESS